MVTKKKEGKEVEEQDGWLGRILPFELVQETHLKPELHALREQENRLGEITASIDEALENLSEEEKSDAISQEIVNEEGDKFVNAALAKEAKSLLAEAKKTGAFDPPFDDESYEAKIIQVADWQAEEKTLKAAIKQAAAALHLKTKATIEALSDAQVYDLLELKWITPLEEALHQLPGQQMDTLVRKLEALVEKYRITYADNAREIQQTEAELAGMIAELEGNEFDLKGLTELKNLLAGD
jgi:type I restriction enzyme M protein